MSIFKIKQNNYSRGFTLVELLVTITIFVILTGVVLFSQRKFDSSILLTNLAYDTALTIRQAQNYGVNVRGFSTGVNNNTFNPFGVHLDNGSKEFVLFSDVDLNNKFSDSDTSCPANDSSSECVERYSIKRGNFIENLCLGVSGSDCTEVESLNILFKRPDVDAYFSIDGAIDQIAIYAKITVASPDGSTRNVVIRKTGQIYVE